MQCLPALFSAFMSRTILLPEDRCPASLWWLRVPKTLICLANDTKGIQDKNVFLQQRPEVKWISWHILDGTTHIWINNFNELHYSLALWEHRHQGHMRTFMCWYLNIGKITELSRTVSRVIENELENEVHESVGFLLAVSSCSIWCMFAA